MLTSTDPEDCVTEYGYNDYSQIATLTVNGNTAAYEYDLAGNISAVTDAEGRRVNFAYDQNGNLTQITYPDGITETTQYDLLGRVVLATPRTGLATAYTYDQLGNVTSVTQGEQITRYEYDLLGRLTKVITPDGAETTYAYDALGNLVGETDPLGNQTCFAYTVESLLEQVTYANGATQSLTYDLAGNVISENDGEGNTKRYHYDRVNRLTAVIDEAGNKTSYGYDALDNITKVTDALKQVTRYTYDKNGNLLTETDALGNTVEYAYTPEGWLSAITKADGTVLTFAYDKTGNLLTQNTGENQNIESSYNEIGQVTTVTSPEGTITYQYNQQGYLVSVTNGNGDVVSYTYDQYGNKLSMTYPDGRVVSYTYDSMNRMTSVTGLDGEVTTYAYDAAGRRVETASRNLTTEYKYDVVGSLVEQTTTGSSNLSFQYNYNLNGYITGEVRTENGETITSAYAYDPLGELISFTQSTGYGEQYTYDKVGNMTAKTITGMDGQTTALKMKYNQGNQLVSMVNGGDKITYKYDKNGSMVQKVLTSKQYGALTDTYAYNSLDQLVSYAGYDGYQQQFAYDANGMRLSKSEYGNSNRSTLEELLRGEIAGLPEVVVPNVAATNSEEAAIPPEYEWATTEYLYDITQEYYQVIQQTTTSGNTTATTAYAYGLERIAAYDANNTTQYIYDGRGSVAQTISAPVAGASVSAALPDVQVQSYAYTAFGEQMGGKVSGFGYNAEDFDAATGMINLRMRQYEPVVGRFEQKDKRQMLLCDSILLGRYVYSINSPLSFKDPSGLKAVNTMHYENRKPYIDYEELEITKKRIIGLANAANAGFSAMRNSTMRNSTDEHIQAAVHATLNKMNEMQMEETDPLYEAESNRLFAKNCMIISMNLAEEYGKKNSIPFSQKETLAVYSAMIAMNPNVSKNEREFAQGVLNSHELKSAPYSLEKVCVPYVADAYSYTTLLSDYDKKDNDENDNYDKIIRKTTPLYATLAGGISREDGNITGGDVPNKFVKAVISLGNKDEAPKIKLAGDSEYIALYNPDRVSFSTAEQYDFLQEAQITQPLDIMFFGKDRYSVSRGKNKKIEITYEDERYNPDVNQVHVVLFDTNYTYSGMGKENGSGKSAVQYHNSVNAEKKYGIDIILMNHERQNIEQAIYQLEGK